MITFFAVELSDECKDKLFEIQTKLSAFCKKSRMIKKENFHVTLRYIGETNKNELELLKDAAATAAKKIKPFDLEFLKLEYFERSDGKILYFALKENKSIIAAYKALEKALEQNGFSREKRRFTAHVTISRDAVLIKSADYSEVNKMLIETKTKANGISIMESTRSTGNLNYSRIDFYEFSM